MNWFKVFSDFANDVIINRSPLGIRLYNIYNYEKSNYFSTAVHAKISNKFVQFHSSHVQNFAKDTKLYLKLIPVSQCIKPQKTRPSLYEITTIEEIANTVAKFLIRRTRGYDATSELPN